MILDAAVSWLVNSINNPAIPLSSAAVSEYLGTSFDNESGVTLNRNAALGLSTIYRAVNMLSNDVASLNTDIFKRDENNGKERDKGHPAYNTVRWKANDFLSAFDWKKMTLAQALLHGNSYSAVERRGDVVLKPLPCSPTTYPVWENGRKWIVTSLEDGSLTRFDASDVIHIHGLSWDGIEGLDILSVMRNTFGLELGTHTHAARFFKRGTMSSGFLTAPQRLGEQQVKDLRENWVRMQTGLSNQGGVGVLHGGADFKPLSIDPEKAQLLQSREFGIVEIANVFNVPPHKLGSSIRSSYASLEAENQDYLRVSLQPWLIAFETELRDKLLTEAEKDADSHVVEFNRGQLQAVDYFNRVNGLVRYKEAGILNSNQIAAIENFPTLGEQGERRYIPANWMPIGDDGLPIATAPESGPPPPQQDSGARQAIMRSIQHAAEHLIGYEAKAVEAAAGREKNFLAWMDEFYGSFQTKLLQAILHDVEAIAAVLRRHDGTEIASRVAGMHVKKSTELLMELAGSSKASLFAGTVRDAVVYWPQRAKALIEAIERMTT